MWNMVPQVYHNTVTTVTVMYTALRHFLSNISQLQTVMQPCYNCNKTKTFTATNVL